MGEISKEKQGAELKKTRIDNMHKSAELCCRLGSLSGSRDMQDFGAMAYHVVDLYESGTNFIDCFNNFISGSLGGVSMTGELLTGAALGLAISIVKMYQTTNQLRAEQEDMNALLRDMFKMMIKGFEHLDKRLTHIEQGQKQIYDLLYFGLKSLERQMQYNQEEIIETLKCHEVKIDMILQKNIQMETLLHALVSSNSYEAILQVINNRSSDFEIMTPMEFKALRDKLYPAMYWDQQSTLFQLINTDNKMQKKTGALKLEEYVQFLHAHSSAINLMNKSNDIFSYLNWLQNLLGSLNPDTPSASLCHPVVWSDAAKAYMVLICNIDSRRFYGATLLSVSDEKSHIAQASQPIENFIAFSDFIQKPDVHQLMMELFLDIQKIIYEKIDLKRQEKIAAYRETHKNLVDNNDKVSPFDLETSIFSLRRIYEESAGNPYLESAKELISDDKLIEPRCFPYKPLNESLLFEFSLKKRVGLIGEIKGDLEPLKMALEMHMLVWRQLNRLSFVKDDIYYSAFLELSRLQDEVCKALVAFEGNTISFEQYQCRHTGHLKQSQALIEFMRGRLVQDGHHPPLFDRAIQDNLTNVVGCLKQVPRFLELATKKEEIANVIPRPAPALGYS